jgi:hypothetical protein
MYNEEHREEYNWSERQRYALKRKEILEKKRLYFIKNKLLLRKKAKKYRLLNLYAGRLRDRIYCYRKKLDSIKDLMFIEVY